MVRIDRLLVWIVFCLCIGPEGELRGGRDMEVLDGGSG